MKGSEQESRSGGPDRIEQLLRNAVARERPSAADERAIRAALRAEWQAVTRRRWRRIGWLAAGAAAALVAAVVTLQRPPPGSAAAVDAVRLARVEAAVGRVRLRTDDDTATATAEAGAMVRAGQKIETGGAARLALRWRDGSSVRVDERTVLRLTAEGGAELIRGRLYVDAGASMVAADAPVILTPAGPVRHLGTRYMASVDAGTTRIGVREGRVALTFNGMQNTARGGQELSIGPNRQPNLRPIPAYGENWRWAESLAGPFAAEGRSMADFLDWVGRESGRRVEYASAETEDLARATGLHGTVELEPMRALEPVLRTSNLTHIVDNGVIRVRLRTDE